jgi:alpha-glucosidase
MNLLDPHHDGSPTYLDPGPIRLGDTVPVRLWVPSRPGADARDAQVHLRVWRDGEPSVTPARLDRTEEAGAWFTGEVEVRNPHVGYRFLVQGGGGYRWVTSTGTWDHDVSDRSDFRLTTARPAPGWVADQIVYQVFPDRFASSGVQRRTPAWAQKTAWDAPVIGRGPGSGTQWYGGDLDGVAEHLDALADLSASTLYLTPFFEGRSVHRYDALSFDQVDPALGGDAALDRLLDAAHRRGIRVVGDLTLNHTGSQHAWFRRAVADAASPEAGYYVFEHHPDRYESWLGVPSLPKLDHRSQELRRALYDGPGSVVARWLDRGLDGWRIDVANMVGRLGAVDLAHEVARTVRATMAAGYEDAWLLAEHGHDAAGDGDLSGEGWHGTMTYAGFTRPVWTWLADGTDPHDVGYLGLPGPVPRRDGQAVVRAMREARSGAPWQAWAASTLHLDSHDTPRLRTITGGGGSGGVDHAGTGRQGHLLGLALQMTLPGVPVIFAGDELGLTGTTGEQSRTPYPWNGLVDEQTRAQYRAWTRVRREQVALRRGGLRFVSVGADHLTFVREHPEQVVLVHVARAAHSPVVLPLAGLHLSGLAPLVSVGSVGLDADGADVRLGASGAGAGVWVGTPII